MVSAGTSWLPVEVPPSSANGLGWNTLKAASSGNSAGRQSLGLASLALPIRWLYGVVLLGVKLPPPDLLHHCLAASPSGLHPAAGKAIPFPVAASSGVASTSLVNWRLFLAGPCDCHFVPAFHSDFSLAGRHFVSVFNSISSQLPF